MEKTSHNEPDVIFDDVAALGDLKTLTVRWPMQLVTVPTQVWRRGELVDAEVQVVRKMKRKPSKDYSGRGINTHKVAKRNAERAERNARYAAYDQQINAGRAL